MSHAQPPLLPEELESLLWDAPADELARCEPVLRARLRADGKRPEDILADLPDEVLAVAVRKEFWLDEAFEELFARRAMGYLAVWFRRRRVNLDLAQDLTQDLLSRFWERRLPTYDPKHSFQAYLFISARNLLAETQRKRRPVPVPNDQLDAYPDPDGPELTAEWHELAERVERAVARLPPDQEQVVRMVLNDKAPPEIAQALGFPLKRVYRLTYLARRGLEAALQGKSRL